MILSKNLALQQVVADLIHEDESDES
jgi:hypothetical protein